MKYSLLTLIFSLLLCSQSVIATSIIQCRQADGSIEFTNKSCSKKKIKKSADFLQVFFIQQQERLLQAKTQDEIRKQGKIITQTIHSYAQQGQLSSAYNMIAVIYAKLSKQIKKSHWQGQPVSPDKQNIRLLFKNILISQSTTSSIEEFSHIIDQSWRNYRLNENKKVL